MVPNGQYPGEYAEYGDPGSSWQVVDKPVMTTPSDSPGPTYGPSSAHPAVVVSGMGDGSVQAISKRTDAANLFFLITKNNSDPFNIP